ncbi:hypothetical protein H0H87_011245, partial [Tephrocybe sp. NHM501043]
LCPPCRRCCSQNGCSSSTSSSLTTPARNRSCSLGLWSPSPSHHSSRPSPCRQETQKVLGQQCKEGVEGHQGAEGVVEGGAV